MNEREEKEQFIRDTIERLPLPEFAKKILVDRNITGWQLGRAMTEKKGGDVEETWKDFNVMVLSKIGATVAKVNNMTPEEQKAELVRLAARSGSSSDKSGVKVTNHMPPIRFELPK